MFLRLSLGTWVVAMGVLWMMESAEYAREGLDSAQRELSQHRVEMDEQAVNGPGLTGCGKANCHSVQGAVPQPVHGPAHPP